MAIKKVFFVILIFSSFSVKAQDEGISINPEAEGGSRTTVSAIIPKHTFNVIVGLPNATINKPFESIMKGIVNVKTYYQYALKNSMVFGVGAQYMHFKVNEFRVPEPIRGIQYTAGIFAKIGYEKFYTTRFGMDFSLIGGYNLNWINTDLNKKVRGKSYQFDCGFLEPTVGFILTATEHSSFRLTAGYTFQGYIFTPFMLGTMMDGGWEPSEFERTAQFMTFSFGYTYYFNQKN